MPLERRVFAELCSGRPCSGEYLASRLTVTRSAVWKAIEKLRELGLPINAQRPAGYCLPQALSSLDAVAITSLLPGATRRLVRQLEVEWSLGSTNDELLSRRDLPPGRCDVLLAENQQAGRGRRARQWFSVPGASLCLSLSWQYPALPADASALSLAIGVAAVRALRSLHDFPLQLKWPNDLQSAGRKLGGILIELRAEAAGPAYFVVGIGINVAMPGGARQLVKNSGTQLVDLSELTGGAIDRNTLAARLIGELVAAMQEFGRSGLASFRDEWQRHDALAGVQVQLSGAGGVQTGQAEGVDNDGALRLRTSAGIVRVVSGEISLRAAS
jgi:BirA family biotin operon repressor/biotin-[acetyl-CoA-carboxylase] ligase